ncbi:hypothetical protein EVAR_45726_1 [Eumeta japonica]|uniref:Transmembrane protein n=1 Tax=Eumeta variegata TaxID=151549 RepID=A0A4C1WZ88_EUMVA|nr:hypothetical protein EVAR_45726_1 [Eumeta japonica]
MKISFAVASSPRGTGLGRQRTRPPARDGAVRCTVKNSRFVLAALYISSFVFVLSRASVVEHFPGSLSAYNAREGLMRGKEEKKVGRTQKRTTCDRFKANA